MSTQMRMSALLWELSRDGVTTSTAWDPENAMRRVGQNAGWQQWWRDYREDYSQTFRDHVDALIRDGEAAG